jgi:hypothetical protein
VRPFQKSLKADRRQAGQAPFSTRPNVRACGALTERQGDTLSQDKAAPFIVNFEMVDTNKDGKVTEDEFMEGCKKGLVQEAASKPGETGGGQTPEQPTSKQ